MGEVMKCLSVRQPWANWLVGQDPMPPACFGLPKDVENRSWRTHYRGDLVVHAGLAFDRDAIAAYGPFERRQFLRGVLVGVVRLAGCYPAGCMDSEWAMEAAWHWHIVNPRAFQFPIPWAGQLGLFEVPVTALGGQHRC